MRARAGTVVVGVGNTLMSDDGIGPCVIEAMREKLAGREDVELVDAGTGGMNVVHAIAGRDKAVIVDCALMGAKSGAIKRFTPEEARSVKHVSAVSFHDIDIFKVLEVSSQLGERPGEVVLFGIEPETIERGMGISDALEKHMAEYVGAIEREIVD